MIGKRGISGSSLGSENTIILTLDDSRKVLCDLKIPEVYAAVLKKNLKLNAKFSAALYYMSCRHPDPFAYRESGSRTVSIRRRH